MPQGTVKWFNNAKGYGFIVEDGHSEDLFAHFSAIQMDGYKTLKAGQAVVFEKQPGEKGFHAVNICAVEQRAHDPVDHDEFISVEEPSSTLSQNSEKTQSQTTQTSKHTESV